MSLAERAALFRRRAAEMETKATHARSETSRERYLVLARQWKAMAARDELKYLNSPPLAADELEHLENELVESLVTAHATTDIVE